MPSLDQRLVLGVGERRFQGRPAFFFVPLLSTLLGAVLGTFLGAVAGEMTGRDPRSVGGSMKPALGATAGRVVGTAGKVGIATVAWLALAASAFIP